MNFSDLGLDPALVRQCGSLGFEKPTPIQREAVPRVIDGADIIGCAETGTGKTAAFLLPAIQKMMVAPRPGTRLLVIAPTRELAIQIEANYQSLNISKKLKSVILVGGASIKKQLDGLKHSPAVVIATPGRLIDHIERRSVDLSGIEMLVLDEADRMLDMGFWPDVRKVLEKLPAKRQTMLFSATFSKDVENIARSTMRRPILIKISKPGRPAAKVEQLAYPVARESKTALLLHLLENEDHSKVLVFTRTRRDAERISHILSAREHKVSRIHSDRSQSERESALRGFKEGRHRVLVATDIASRGIDVDAISQVINYDVPEAPEDYVHRIGRTGRAGNSGKAVTLVSPIEELSMTAIERLTGKPIERVVLPDFGGTAFMAHVSGKSSRSFGRRRR